MILVLKCYILTFTTQKKTPLFSEVQNRQGGLFGTNCTIFKMITSENRQLQHPARTNTPPAANNIPINYCCQSCIESCTKNMLAFLVPNRHIRRVTLNNNLELLSILTNLQKSGKKIVQNKNKMQLLRVYGEHYIYHA